MQLGVSFPQDETMTDPAAVRDFAQAVEGLGFNYLTSLDHVLGADITNRPGWAGPYTNENITREPMVLLGYIAACTTRLRLGTSVVILPQRQTALVAKQAAEIDVLSGGRMMLGVGVGWNDVEFEALNENFHNRGRRIEEQIAVLRALWTQKTASFKGEWHRISEAGLNPLPVQRPIPIWMGGTVERAVRRIAQLADGWLPSARSVDEFPELLERFQGYAREAGRDPGTISIAARMGLADGSPEEWSRTHNRWAELGASHLGVSTTRVQATSADQHIEALRRFKQAVG